MSSETRYPDIDFTPPATVARQAEHGLNLRRKHRDGGTAGSIARARDLAAGKPVGPSTVKRMRAFFEGHAIEKRAEHFGDEKHPSPGYIAWLLWGGDAGEKWSRDIAEAMSNADASRARRTSRRRQSGDHRAMDASA